MNNLRSEASLYHVRESVDPSLPRMPETTYISFPTTPSVETKRIWPIVADLIDQHGAL